MALPNIIQEINTIKSTYLPKSGGVMTGGIYTPGYGCVTSENSTSQKSLALLGCSTKGESCASINLKSIEDPDEPGLFYINAKDDTYGNKSLVGRPNGILTWNGIEVATRDIPTYVAAETLTAPAVTGKLCVVKASKDNAPNNGMILSTYTNASWWGQLYIGDNSTQGIYFRGMSDGVVGSWYRLVDENRCKAFVTATYVSGTTWYRMYSDGWIEQGGYVSTGGTFTFPKAFSNNNYSVVLGSVTTSTYTTQYTQILLSSKSATSVSGTKNSGVGLFVSACGY